MEIKCTKCGHPNQLGAIFCRGCGEKLELENLQPDVKTSSKSRIGITPYAIKRLISMIITITLIAVIICLFLPAGFNPSGETSEKLVTTKHKVLYNRLNGLGFAKVSKLNISADELGAVVTKDLNKQYEDNKINVDTSDQTYLVRKVTFVKTSDTSFDIHATIRFNMGFTTDITNTLSFSHSSNSEGVRFILTGAKYGKVPVPGFARGPIIKNFKQILAQNDKIEDMVANLKEIKINDKGNYEVHFKPFVAKKKDDKKADDKK